jgi:hypothetical protein
MYLPYLNLRKPHIVYDDPSGLPEPELFISIPAPLVAPVELAASRAGMTPSAWLADVVKQSLRPTTVRAI